MLPNCKISLLLMNPSLVLLRLVHTKRNSVYCENTLNRGGPQLRRCATIDIYVTFPGFYVRGLIFKGLLLRSNISWLWNNMCHMDYDKPPFGIFLGKHMVILILTIQPWKKIGWKGEYSTHTSINPFMWCDSVVKWRCPLFAGVTFKIERTSWELKNLEDDF